MRIPTQALPEVGGCSKTARELQHLEASSTQRWGNQAVYRLLILAPVVSFGPFSTLAKDSTNTPPYPSYEVAPPGSAISERSSFVSTNWNIGLTLGAGFGVSAMGSTKAHDLAVATLHVGKLLESERPLFRHVEFAGELWGGAQYHPDVACLVGFTPVVRYHFLPGARWTPFLDAGAGVTATDIKYPDLSTTFEFNLQAGAGFHWALRQNLAFTFQARYLHVSNAGIDRPNHGVNSFLFSGGLTWFF